MTQEQKLRPDIWIPHIERLVKDNNIEGACEAYLAVQDEMQRLNPDMTLRQVSRKYTWLMVMYSKLFDKWGEQVFVYLLRNPFGTHTIN